MVSQSLEQLMEEARQIITDLGLTDKMLGNTQVYVFLTLLGMIPNPLNKVNPRLREDMVILNTLKPLWIPAAVYPCEGRGTE